IHSKCLAGVEGFVADGHVKCHTHRLHNRCQSHRHSHCHYFLGPIELLDRTTVNFVITFEHQLEDFLTCERFLLSRRHLSDAANESTGKTKLQTLFCFSKKLKLKNSG
ncbi:unnamed protein product, partial [Ixodes pacificus]